MILAVMPPLLLLGGLASPAPAQEDGGRFGDLERAVDDLERDVRRLRSEVSDLERRPEKRTIIEENEVGWTVLLLFGGFCALWAQDTGRNPWLWFVLGLIFNAIAVIVLLWKNSNDRKDQAASGKPYMPDEVY
jgi:hypothetical protein